MSEKRIAMISYHTCPLASLEGKETGGMNVYVLELSKELAKKGYAVDIFTRSQNTRNKKIIKITSDLRLMHLTAGPQKPVPKKQLTEYIPDFVKSYEVFVEDQGLVYDILHCHYYLSGLIGLQIKKNLINQPPLVMSFHTLALMKNLVARDELEKENKVRIDNEILLTREAHRIIAPSESDKSYLEYLYGVPQEKISIVSPGVDTKLFKPMDKRQAKKFIKADIDHKIILFVGRIEPLKGIDALIYAMKILSVRNPKLIACLWIVGGDVSQKPWFWSKQLKKLEELRRHLHISATIKFVGQRPQKELPYYYNAADVVVMPSHYESFGMVALEAMACGVPVITTNVAGVSSLIDDRHSSLITTVNNPLLLASQIEQLLTNNKVHLKISLAVRKQVLDLKWENIAKEMASIYANLIA